MTLRAATVAITTGHEIRRAVETLMIEHTAFTEVLTILQRRISDTFAGFTPCFELLTGPSRCGKTEVLKAIARAYPETKIGGRRQIPLLVVYITSSTTPKDLPLAVIRALGLPSPRHSMKVAELNNYMHTQLRLAAVRVILFDEASHLVDVGARIPPRAASDWFKDLQANALDVGIVLTGVPRLKRLPESNEQLRNRTHKPIQLMPYRWDVVPEQKDFAGCVMAFLNEFKSRGCTLELSWDSFARHCYALSAGQVGLLASFFIELAIQIEQPQVLTQTLCLKATKNLNLPGDRVVQPFVSEVLDDIHLMQTLSSELAIYGIALPTTTVERQLAQAKVNAARVVPHRVG